MLRNSAIRLHHLLILLTVIGLLPVALIGAWGIYAGVLQQQRELERSMRDLSGALATAVDAELEASISALRSMAYNPLLVQGELTGFYHFSSEVLRTRPDWVNLILNDRAGALVFKSSLPYRSKQGTIIDPASLAKSMASRAPFVGNISRGQTGNFAVPIRFPVLVNDQVRYVLTAVIRPDRIVDIIRRQHLPASWVVAVHDVSSLRVARSRAHASTVGMPISASLAALIQPGSTEGFGISRTLEGIETYTAYATIPSHGWTVVISVPTAELKRAASDHLLAYGGTIAAALVLCLLLAAFISRKVIKAIHRLQGQALQVGRGQPVQLTRHLIDEVDQIGIALESASRERMAVEQERETLMVSLNQALARAEEASQAKDNFLAVLGHELRNPLAPMVTALELMAMKGDASNLAERQIMQRQVRHMRRLVDDLLDVSRIVQGKLEMRFQAVNLRVVVERALEAMHPAVMAHPRAMQVQANSDVWVNGDETRLVQVVVNLLANALRFGRDGDVELAMYEFAGQGHITVRDHGVGMNCETAAQVFERFYQAPQSLARSSGGLGLGLAIVHSIVELHAGSVSAASAGLNKGSAFEVRLPVIAAPGRACAQGHADELRRSHARVLVVDDNVDAAVSVAQLLRMAGHQVEVAHDAEAALAVFANSLPELALLDIGLPGMDGYELAQALRAAHPAWHGKLIALTGYGQQADKLRSAETGFDLHLTKPVDADDLLGAVASVLA